MPPYESSAPAAAPAPAATSAVGPLGLPPALVAPLLAFFLLSIANGVLGTHVSLAMDALGAGMARIGRVQAAYFAGLMLGAPLAVAAIDRFGQCRAFGGYAVTAAIAALGHLASEAEATWIALRLAAGASIVGVYACIESLLNAGASNEARGRLVALYLISSYGGLTVGQFLLGAAGRVGLDGFLLAGALFSTSLLPLRAWARVEAAQPARRAARRRLAGLAGPLIVLRAAPLGLAACAIAGVLLGGFYGMQPVALRGLGLSATASSNFMGFVMAGALLTQWPAARLADSLGRPRALAWLALAGLLLALLAAALAWLAAGTAGAAPGMPIADKPGRLAGDAASPLAVCVVALLHATVIFSFYGLAVSHANDALPSATRVAAAAMLLCAFSAGGSAGPMLVSAAMEAAGPAGFWLTGAAGCGLLALATLVAVRHAGRS
ncbi:MFS transporter [Derxia gummosa]|uniref:MFS transporter n=1 Tax=Derxia gummosa DSM 723 TaxID=1121388 RepID=A0A8B6X8D4_9BURK|nr:MFS transporter [Derxia gummosa]